MPLGQKSYLVLYHTPESAAQDGSALNGKMTLRREPSDADHTTPAALEIYGRVLCSAESVQSEMQDSPNGEFNNRLVRYNAWVITNRDSTSILLYVATIF